MLQQVVERAHGLLVAIAAVVVALVSWPLVVCLPLPVDARVWIARHAGMIIRHIAGVNLAIVGDPEPPGGTVFVANHESVLDGPILFIALVGSPTFVVGSTFERMPLIGRYLARIGCLFVGDGTWSSAVDLTGRLVEVLRSGRGVVVFPEGSVSHSVGVHSFHLGAFRAAANAPACVAPIGIRGTRGIVARGQRLPRPGSVELTLGAALAPAGSDWRSVCARRDASRAEVGVLTGWLLE